ERQAAHRLAIEIDQGLDLRFEAEGGAAADADLAMMYVSAAVELGHNVEQHAEPRDVAHLDQVEYAVVELGTRHQLHAATAVFGVGHQGGEQPPPALRYAVEGD